MIAALPPKICQQRFPPACAEGPPITPRVPGIRNRKRPGAAESRRASSADILPALVDSIPAFVPIKPYRLYSYYNYILIIYQGANCAWAVHRGHFEPLRGHFRGTGNFSRLGMELIKGTNRVYKAKSPRNWNNSGEKSWQREKDSNPHIRSQSPLCYLYTIPLCEEYYIHSSRFVKRNISVSRKDVTRRSGSRAARSAAQGCRTSSTAGSAPCCSGRKRGSRGPLT